ncbi:MAG: glycosyltransferase [Roseovarius sp.]|nr:glycosyltransferase [Roseovarius sp.]
MTTAPLVSIILPTYNRAHTLLRAVNSVLNQNYREIELIVVDDASTDGSAALLAEIRDPRVRVIYHENNKGLGAARNTGVFAATGDLIAFQDSDDEWLDGKLEKQVTAFRNASLDCVCVYCIKIVYGRNADRIAGDRQVVCVPGPEFGKVSGDLRKILWRTNLVSTQTILCTREVARKVGGFDNRLRNSVDWDFVLRLAEQGTFEFVNLPLVNTYIQNDSVSKLTQKALYSQVIITNKMKRRGVPREILAEHWARLGYHIGKRGNTKRRGAVLLRNAITARPLHAKTWLRYIMNRLSM